MQISDVVAALNDTGFAWTIAKGRTRLDEPIYAIAMYAVDDHGLSSDKKYVFVVEGEDLCFCATRAQAFALSSREAAQRPTAAGAGAPDASTASQPE